MTLRELILALESLPESGDLPVFIESSHGEHDPHDVVRVDLGERHDGVFGIVLWSH